MESVFDFAEKLSAGEMANNPMTFSEFQKNTIKNLSNLSGGLSIEPIDIAIRFACEVGIIFNIVNERNNPNVEATPMANLNMAKSLGNMLRDICIMAGNYGYTLGYVSNKAGKIELKEFVYPKGLDKSADVKEANAEIIESVKKKKPKEEDW